MTTLMAIIILILVGVLLLYAAVGMRSFRAKGKHKSKTGQFGEITVIWSENQQNLPPIVKNFIENITKQLLIATLNRPGMQELTQQMGSQYLEQEIGLVTKLRDGKTEEAIRAYAAYMQMDYYSARDVVYQLAEMLHIEVVDDRIDSPEELAKFEEDIFGKPKRGTLDKGE